MHTHTTQFDIPLK